MHRFAAFEVILAEKRAALAAVRNRLAHLIPALEGA
jgi:hypothetical protein